MASLQQLTACAQEKVRPEAAMPAARVLIMDSDSDFAEFIRRGLQEENCTVKVCFDSGSGLREAEIHAFDIILLDILLPAQVIDGFDLTKRLRLLGCKLRSFSWRPMPHPGK